ncbi:MAG: SPOR domain-containing protein, partial [Notoacmeibacter sp.]
NGDAPAVPEQAAEQVAAAEAPPLPAAGSYSIQIASTPSEEAAASALRSLSGKFGSILGGKDYMIQRAEVPGKGTVYRVRIVAGSKDDASKLCSRYKSAGGSCFVTR